MNIFLSIIFVWLLSYPVCLHSFENIDGELLRAAEKGDTERCRELLDKGASIDCRNNYGVTALIWTANNNHLETLQLLVSAKADKEARGNDGRTALMWASVWGHLEVVRFLVAEGARLDERDRRGLTSLQHAVFHNHIPVAELLLESGADPAIENVYKGTALSIARLNGNAAAVQLLERRLSAHEEDRYQQLAEALGERIEAIINTTIQIVVRWIDELAWMTGYKSRQWATEL